MTLAVELILRVHLPGARSYELGDEIWQTALPEAIAEEADAIVLAAGGELLREPTTACREQLRARVITEMTTALYQAGDTYTAPDGVTYSITTLDGRPR